MRPMRRSWAKNICFGVVSVLLMLCPLICVFVNVYPVHPADLLGVPMHTGLSGCAVELYKFE